MFSIKISNTMIKQGFRRNYDEVKQAALSLLIAASIGDGDLKNTATVQF